jgi:hypothetical protein
MSWYVFDDGKTIGLIGSESGVVMRDEEHGDGARLPWNEMQRLLHLQLLVVSMAGCFIRVFLELKNKPRQSLIPCDWSFPILPRLFLCKRIQKLTPSRA